MSDNLRDRIAAEVLAECAMVRDEGGEATVSSLAAYRVADAVIEALGLEQEDGECGYCYAQLPGCRYVTEMSADE